jgi:putative lipoic acid-binding regulatory protein
MSTEAQPAQTFPQRIPLKVIGRGAELDPARIAALIQAHLGPQAQGDLVPGSNQRGAYTSLTFWVTLPGPEAERPLREAIQALAGVVMQL